MKEIQTTSRFRNWFDALRDDRVRERVRSRLWRLAEGNPGSYRVLSGGVREMKLDIGSGIRVYYAERGTSMILILVGGDKSTQQRDIRTAAALLAAGAETD